MSDVTLQTLSMGFRKARATSQTSASYVAKIPTATEPAGDANTAVGASVIELGPGTGQNAAIICFYGTGTDNQTFSCQLIGWRDIGAGLAYSVTTTTKLWFPVVLAEFAVVLSAVYPGVAGKTIAATELFADTITLTYGNDDVSLDLVSPGSTTADIGIAHVVLDLKGFQKLEPTFKVGTATSGNALLALL